MKVKIGKYASWFGPYQLAELLLFWIPKKKDEYGFSHNAEVVHNFGEWLAYGKVIPEPKPGEIYSFDNEEKKTLLYRFLLWIDSKKKRKIKVRIDPWDTWSMDNTLAHIIHPMLIQLKETKHGAPYVDDKDVPVALRSTSAPPKKSESDIDDNHFKRWEWVLDEMIFAFANSIDDSWKEAFYRNASEFKLKKHEDGSSEMIQDKRRNKEYNKDMKALEAYENRIQNGFKLFGKYYQNLWD